MEGHDRRECRGIMLGQVHLMRFWPLLAFLCFCGTVDAQLAPEFPPGVFSNTAALQGKPPATYTGIGDIAGLSSNNPIAWWGLRCFSSTTSRTIADITDSATGNTTGTDCNAPLAVSSPRSSAPRLAPLLPASPVRRSPPHAPSAATCASFTTKAPREVRTISCRRPTPTGRCSTAQMVQPFAGQAHTLWRRIIRTPTAQRQGRITALEPTMPVSIWTWRRSHLGPNHQLFCGIRTGNFTTLAAHDFFSYRVWR